LIQKNLYTKEQKQNISLSTVVMECILNDFPLVKNSFPNTELIFTNKTVHHLKIIEIINDFNKHNIIKEIIKIITICIAHINYNEEDIDQTYTDEYLVYYKFEINNKCFYR
jgi:hypothetical protein